MDKELIERLAQEAGIEPDGTGYSSGGRKELQRFASLIAEECVAPVQSELDHAAINDHRLAPAFGKRVGDPAVRAASIEAALDAIRQKFKE